MDEVAIVRVTTEDGTTEEVVVATDSILRAKEIAEGDSEVLYRGGATKVVFVGWKTREEN